MHYLFKSSAFIQIIVVLLHHETTTKLFRLKIKNMSATLEFVKAAIAIDLGNYANKYETSVKELFFGDCINIYFNAPTLEFSFDGYVIYADSDSKETIGKQFTCSFKTPKGYISNKKINVNIADASNVTIEEASELLKYNTDAIKNNFDPFYKENQAKSRNAAAWNFIASNYLQDDCR